MTVDDALLHRARSGDGQAFAELVEPHRRELHVHCYRMLGSFDDADDAVQEALLAAWRGLATFQAKASIRTWLYRVATNTCLNLLRTATRRPQMALTLPTTAPVRTGSEKVTWLQPYPDTRDDINGLWHGSGLLVITVRGDQVAGLTRFESHTLRAFGLPRVLPDDDPA